MSQALTQTVTSYIFSSEEERQRMIRETTFVCCYKNINVRFDPTDGTFWSFGKESKVLTPKSEIRTMPEVKSLGVKLSEFKKK